MQLEGEIPRTTEGHGFTKELRLAVFQKNVQYSTCQITDTKGMFDYFLTLPSNDSL